MQIDTINSSHHRRLIKASKFIHPYSYWVVKQDVSFSKKARRWLVMGFADLWRNTYTSKTQQSTKINAAELIATFPNSFVLIIRIWWFVSNFYETVVMYARNWNKILKNYLNIKTSFLFILIKYFLSRLKPVHSTINH